jgi:hypothetical protein
MQELRARISHELKVACYCPQNGMEVTVARQQQVPPLTVSLDPTRLQQRATLVDRDVGTAAGAEQPRAGGLGIKRALSGVELSGALVAKRNRSTDGGEHAALCLIPPADAAAELGLLPHAVSFTASIGMPPVPGSTPASAAALGISTDLASLHSHLVRVLAGVELQLIDDTIHTCSVRLRREPDSLCLTWTLESEALAVTVLASCEDWAELQSIGSL